MKKHSIILHLGPCRTSTTYLFNLLLHNNQLNNTVQMNVPQCQIELLQWCLAQNIPHDDGLMGSVYMLANNIKEDPSVNSLYSHTSTGHPLGPQTPDPIIHSAIDAWLNRMGKAKQVFKLVGSSVQRARPTLNNRLHADTHNSQQHIPWLAKQLNYPNQPSDHTLLHGTQLDKLSTQLPIVAFAPTLTNGGMFTNNAQYSVQTTTTTEQLQASIPHKQQVLLWFIDALSTQFEHVELLLGLRDPSQRMSSWLKHLDNLNIMPQHTDVHSYTEHNPELMRQWIDSQLKLYSDYPILSVLADANLPHNVKLTTYEHNNFNIEHIFPQLSNDVNMSVGKLSSSHSDINPQLNPSWCKLNQCAVERLRRRGHA